MSVKQENRFLKEHYNIQLYYFSVSAKLLKLIDILYVAELNLYLFLKCSRIV